MKNAFGLLVLTLVIVSLGGCGLWDEPDFRDTKWGMSKREVKEKETAELVKEGQDVLTYRITGDMIDLSSRTKAGTDTQDKEATKEEGGEAPPDSQVTPIHFEYDLLYVFGDDKLGMAVIHLRESLKDPEDYIEQFRLKSTSVSGKIGAPAQGIAEYPSGENPKENPYDNPADICKGEYVLKHVWPTDRKKTNVSLELDRKKFSSEDDCNLSIFYESTQIEIDPVLRDQLHDVL